MMKWIILTGFLVCLARFGAGGALKCTPGVENPLCRIDIKESSEEVNNGTESASQSVEQSSSNSDKTSLVQGKECAPGTHWKSKCNDCACSPEGHPYCTEKACPGHELESEKECAPESRWKNECNTCWCTPDGLAFCTKIGCGGIPANQHFKDESSEEKPDIKVPLSRKTRGLPQANTQSTPKACEPGKVFRMDCNQCLCDNEGQDFSCTRIDCIALNNINNGGSRRKRDNEFDEPTKMVTIECPPATLFDFGCNACRCQLDGHKARCTKRQCTNDKGEPVTDSSFRCNPGEQFKRDCKDCTCSADGKSIFCSLRLCDKDLAHVID